MIGGLLVLMVLIRAYRGFSSFLLFSVRILRVFLDMVLVFFLPSFLGIEWPISARSQLVFLHSEPYSIIGVMGGPCCVFGGSGVLSQGAESLCVLCVWCFFSMVI